MARRCVFCGVAGGLTKEHVLPRWMSEVLSRSAEEQFVHQCITDDPAVHVGTFRASAMEIKTKTTCASCNNGWMSELESVASPYLQPMLVGQETSLDRTALKTLAVWAAKTAMTSALASPRFGHAVSTLIASHLFLYKSPPPQTHVWIGAYAGPPGAPLKAANLSLRIHALHNSATQTVDVLYDWTAVMGRLLMKVVVVPERYWGSGVTISLDVPKPLWLIHGRGAVGDLTWTAEQGYFESEVVQLSAILSPETTG